MINRLICSASFVAFSIFFLSACSGGGGGGGASAVSAPAPAAPAVAMSGGPVSLQPDNTTVAYQSASATALVTNAGVGGVANAPSGQGATITMTTNASGVTTIVFNIPTTGRSEERRVG